MTKNQKKATNVASINNHYTKEQIQQAQKAQKQLIFRRRRLAVIFVGAAIVFLLLGMNLFKSSQELSARKAEKVDVVKEQQELQGQQAALEDEVKLLKDEAYVAKLARSKYLFSKEGEQVYKLPAKNQNQGTEQAVEKVQNEDTSTSSSK